ncbi:MAG: hypothetical protein L0323_22685 [Planctomycetes bacterium]|nr:hypothetical protein [Planctomycetota bacterium]
MIGAALLSTVLGLAQGQGPPDSPVRRVPQGQESAAEPVGIRLEKARGGDMVVVEPGVTLGDLAFVGEGFLGRVCHWKPEVEHILRTARPGLSARQEVPLAEFDPWIETVLLANDFVLILPAEGSQEPVQLVSLRGTDRNRLQSSARFVPAEELPRYRHPATLVLTTVRVRYLDPKVAAANLRPYFTDPNLENVSAMGDTLHFQGFPRRLASCLTILREADHESEARALAPPPDRGTSAAGSGAGTSVEDLAARVKQLEDGIEVLRAMIKELTAERRR